MCSTIPVVDNDLLSIELKTVVGSSKIKCKYAQIKKAITKINEIIRYLSAILGNFIFGSFFTGNFNFIINRYCNNKGGFMFYNYPCSQTIGVLAQLARALHWQC